MKKEKLDDYELFYLEIPQSDYLNDIDLSDVDTDKPSLNETPNLSSEQVSAIARDQLAESGLRPRGHDKVQDDTPKAS